MVEGAAHSLLRSGDRVVCLGDSITADPEGYVTMARQVLRLSRPDSEIELINAGVCGSTVTDMLSRFERDVLAKKPTWVTISAGVNDAARSVPVEEYAPAVAGMIDLAQSRRVRIGLCTPTCFEDPAGGDWAAKLNQRLGAYAAWLERTADERDCLLIPMFEVFRLALETSGCAGELWLTQDGCHMSPAGRYLMGLTFVAAFRVSLPADSDEVPVPP